MSAYRPCVFFLYFLLLACPSAGQVSRPISTAGATEDPDERIRIILREILEAGGYPTLEIQLRQDRKIRNAMAIREGRLLYLKYNPDFIAGFEQSARTQYATFALLAHEVGHHALGHDMEEKNSAQRKKNELNADGFAGMVLNMMCISLDDATAGFRSMDQDVSGGDYPPPSVREAAVGNGWLERNAYFQKLGGHPCDRQVPFRLKQGEKLTYNRSQNVQAIIKGKRMEITYDLPKDVPEYRVYFSIDPTAPLTPKSLQWVGNPAMPGDGRTLIWNFGEDGYTRPQVEGKSEWMGIAAYAPKYVPQPLSSSIRILHFTGIAAGAALLGYGAYLKSDALQMYDTYKNNQNPGAAIYGNGNLSRQEMFDTANRRNKWALGALVVGGTAAGLSAWWLIGRSRSERRFKAAHFYSAAPHGFQLEGLVFGTGDGPGIGLTARF